MTLVHSFSSMEAYDLCPRYYEAKYIERDPRCKFEESPASKKGNVQHKQLAKCIEKRVDPPAEFNINPNVFELLKAHAVAEAPLAMTHDERPCGFWDERAWFRGFADVYIPIVRVSAAFILDWKSGKPGRANPLQAKSYGALAYIGIGARKTLFSWSYFNYKDADPPPMLVDGRESLYEVTDKLQRMENALNFPPKQSWKCRFCPLTECEFNRSQT